VSGNQIEAGTWFESNSSTIRRVGWRLRNYTAAPDVDFANVIRLFFDRTGELTSNLFYVQNTNRLLDNRLTLTYGAKYLHMDADFSNNKLASVPNAQTTGDLARPDFS